MFAGVRNVAWGAAMVMAGLLAVIVTNCIWMAYFRLYEGILGLRPAIFCMFCDDTRPPLVELIPELIRVDSIIGLAVVIWLIAFAIRRASRSI